MAGRPVAGIPAGVAACALALPLWAAGCVSPPQPTPPPSPVPLLEVDPTPTPATAPAAPEPQRQSPPPEETVWETSGSAQLPEETIPAGTPEVPAAQEVPPVEDPGSPGPVPSASAAVPQRVTAYYVLLDDGGSNGVRFGCNDSLVGVAHTSSDGEDPLPAAVGALLRAPAEQSQSRHAPDVYNALWGSDLKFLSGSFDGTTVTVYLAGKLSLGGVCDLPRVEAQLTQTAVSAVGGIRAEIYINGQSLSEILRQD